MKREARIQSFIFHLKAKIFGIIQVSKPACQARTKDTNWLAIDFEPVKTLELPISLWRIKAALYLQNIGLIKQPRLSVMPLSKQEFEVIVNKGTFSVKF